MFLYSSRLSIKRILHGAVGLELDQKQFFSDFYSENTHRQVVQDIREAANLGINQSSLSIQVRDEHNHWTTPRVIDSFDTLTQGLAMAQGFKGMTPKQVAFWAQLVAITSHNHKN